MNQIELTLTPYWDGETIRTMDVTIKASVVGKQGESLFYTNDKTIFKPFTALKENVTVNDNNGIVICTEETEDHGYILARAYKPERDTQGAVTIHYVLDIGPNGRNPVFDLGYEKGGITGSGNTFLPSFAKGEYEYSVHWDLSHLPQGCSGVWSYGIGDVTHTGDESLLTQTFYAAGQLDFVKQGSFTYCWFYNDLLLKQAVPIAEIFAYEQKFFHDGNEPYTIIARHTKDETSRVGGTALIRSYSFLYKEDSQLDPTWLKFLFAHEMVHNWVKANDDPFGTCTWYVEGMAEFYSLALTWRMGVVTKEEVLGEINKRAEQYFLNPFIHTSNEELGKHLMQDQEMTRVPYGRGFFYLCHADAMIRKKSEGKYCLDDVLHKMMEREDKQIVGNDDWIEFYGEYVGKDTAEQEYKLLSSGDEVWMPEVDFLNAYNGDFNVMEETGVQHVSNEPCTLWRIV